MRPDPIVLTNLVLCDPASGEVVSGQEILIVEGVIDKVGPDVGSGDLDRLDLAGAYVTPGLIDAHVHVTAGTADLSSLGEESPYFVAAQTSSLLRAMLERGFTTVRDVAGADFGIARAVREGLWTGPRVYYGGKALSPTGGHGDPRGPGRYAHDEHACCPTVGVVCDGVDEVRRAARNQLRTGADHIKIMLSGGVASPTDRIDSLQFSMDEVRAVVEEATNAQRYVTGHAYTAAAVNRGLELGVRCIEHGNLIDDESVRLFREKDAFLVPTLVTYEYLSREGAAAGLPEASQRKVDTVLGAGLEALERAWHGGVRMAFGTDLLGNMQVHQSEEFRIRAQVQPIADILRSATEVGAELLGENGRLGVVAEGAIADLAVWSENPLEDAEVLATPEQHLALVLQNGKVVVDRRA